MNYQADAKEAQKIAMHLQEEGLSVTQAWEQIKQAEVCNCHRPMTWSQEDGRWKCECGNSRFGDIT